MTRYLYLVFCVPVGIVLAWFVNRHLNRLTVRESVPTRLERVTLLALILFGVFTIYGAFFLEESYFGYRDEGLDTVDVYVPFYLDLLDSLRDGTFGLWNFQYGLGASILSYQSWLLDPFNFVLVPLGLLLGNMRLSLALVIVQSLKIVLSGLLFDCLLARYCETPLARIIGSLCYAFSGFLILWGQHYWLGGVAVLFTLMLLLLERLRERWSVSRFLYVVAATAMCVGWSPYCGFMVLVCAAMYMLLRIIHFAGTEHLMRDVLTAVFRLLLPVLCGCLIACVTLVPYALYLTTETSRLSSDGGVSLFSSMALYASDFVPVSWLLLILSRLLGSGLVVTGSAYPEELAAPTELFPYINTYEFICLGFGVLSMVLLLQFAHWVCRDVRSRDRVLVVIAALLVALYCVNSFLPSLLNAFSAPKYRSAFALAVPLCIAISLGWERRVQVRMVARAPLAGGLILTVSVLAWSFAMAVDGHKLAGLYLIIVAIGAVMMIWLSQSSCPNAAILALAAVTFSSTLMDGFFVTNSRVFCTEDDFPAATEAYSGDTMRALDWLSQNDDSLYRVEKTYADWGYYGDALIEGYRGVNAYNSTGSGGVVTYFEALWPGVVGNNGSTQNYRDTGDALELTMDLGVRYLLSRERQGNPFELVDTFGDVSLYRNENASMLSGRKGAISESELMELPTADERRAILTTRVSVPDDVASALPSEDGGETVSVNLRLENGRVIVGTPDVAVDSVACLSIPYSSGWRVFVDGSEVETFRANLGFIGFLMPRGSHDLEVRYELPGFEVGACLSVVGLVVAGVLLGVMTWRQSRTGTSSPSDTRR